MFIAMRLCDCEATPKGSMMPEFSLDISMRPRWGLMHNSRIIVSIEMFELCSDCHANPEGIICL